MAVDRVPVPVATRAPTGRTNAYVADGLLVDPAAGVDELDTLLEHHDVEHVAVSHAHPDHVGGVEAYAVTTDATVWCRAGYEDRFRASTGIVPDRTFREGTAVGPATVIATPGHAPDHVAFALDDAALVGDLAVAEGSVFVGRPDGDVRSYLCSLRRLLVGDFRTLHPAHGPTIEDPDAALSRLIRHRLDRERRILAAVRAGAATVPVIVDAAYEKPLQGVRDLAERTVEAHLEKLAVEGTIEWEGARAVPR